MFKQRKIDALVTLVGNKLPPSSSFSPSPSPCVRGNFKSAGGRKLELKVNSCLAETSGTDRDIVGYNSLREIQTDSISDITSGHLKGS